jgi:hypothetical protein
MWLAGLNYTSRYILNRLTQVIMMPESGHLVITLSRITPT